MSNENGTLNCLLKLIVSNLLFRSSIQYLGKSNESNLPNPKNSEATRLQDKEGNRLQSSTVVGSNARSNPHSKGKKNSNAHSKGAANDEDFAVNEDSDLWREVKRRSRTSSKEPSGVPVINATTPQSAAAQSQAITNPAPTSTFIQPQSTIEKEDLDFQFDEELDMPIGRVNNFTDNWSDDDSDFELSDRDINKILIVTQVKHRAPKHDGYNRTGEFVSRTKISQDLEQVINDGLHNYEEDLWTHEPNKTTSSYKTLNIITHEDFEKMAPKMTTKNPDVPPPPPPTYDEDSRLNQSTGSGLGSKKARFFAVNKEEFIDPRTPRKRKTRHLYNPPVEGHVGWVSILFFVFFYPMNFLYFKI